MTASARALINAMTFLMTMNVGAVEKDWAEAAREDSLSATKNNVGNMTPKAIASSVKKLPLLDGKVREDSAWAIAPPATDFFQTTPNEGQPATERTEVRIVYTADTLYFGVVCYDRDPQHIIISESRRDSPLDETDCFQIILDTYHDKQNGFVFGTNPAGIEYDGQVTNEGEGSGFGPRQQAGAGGGFNINWDAAWEVRTHVADFGWSAEFAIPFRTLRYPSAKEQIWGLNFQRNIRRRNETSFWSPLPRQFNLYRLSQAGTLSGIEISKQRNLKIAPYVLGQGKRAIAPDKKTDWLSEVGGDLKYSLTPSLTLDLTVNTDFAQVEVDEQQINLDRFPLFFPEKRPFFLENAGLFAVGSPGEVEMFFSRRIGIAADGTPVAILGGGRITGKIGATNVGMLNMQTDDVAGVTGANNFTVVRVNHELPNRSALGAMFVNRQSTTDFPPDPDHNRSLAVDGKLGIGRFGQLSGFTATTETPGVGESQHAYKLGASYDSEAWLLFANYTEVGDNFNPEVGFLQRRGFRKPDFLIFHRHRPKNFLRMHELRPHISYRGFWNLDGFHETGFLHLDNHFEWKNGYELHTGMNFTREGVTEAFTIYPGVIVPPGAYDHSEVQLVGITNEGAWWSWRGTLTVGGFFGGDRVSLSQTLKMRAGETFNTELTWNRNDVELPGGSFVANITRARLSYSFNPRIFLQALLQYNNSSDIFSTNLRLGWQQTANTGLFVVYNDNRDAEDSSLRTRDRSFIVKYSRLIDLLE